MKNKLLIFSSLLLLWTGVNAQETPANRTRSGDAFTQTDNYLVAMKRLGIPSGDTPSLDATTDSENTAKLFFNTTDTALYVYRDDLSEWLKVSAESDGGTVTSVGLEAPTGFDVNNSPITSSGNIELEFDDGYSLPTNIKQSEWDEAFNWGDHEGLYLPVSPSSTYKKTETTDLNNLFSSFLYAGVNSENKPSGSAGMVLTGISASENGGQIFVSRGSENDLYFREHSVGSNFPWKKVWDSSNLTNLSDLNNDLSLQDVMDNGNSADGLTIEDLLDPINLQDAATKNYVDDAISGIPTETPDLSDVLGEGNSANNLKITNLSDPTSNLDAANKRYVDDQSVIEALNQGNGIGYRIRGRNPANYGNIGSGAVDFSNSTTASSTRGATTSFSFAAGLNTTASGQGSVALGGGTIASGIASAAFGNLSTASGESSAAFGLNAVASGIASLASGSASEASGTAAVVFGDQNIANEYASLVIGRFSTSGTAETSWTNGSPIFNVGNGSSNNNRKNAYTLYNDGKSEQESTFEITTPGEGVILSSPDGTRWEITVGNDGSLTTTEL